ncbi:MAG: hypothetical protein AAF404_20450 [Pseudomonadota bacterium]
MKQPIPFDPNRRLTLKGIAGAGMMAAVPATAAFAADSPNPAITGTVIDCKLICRDDNSRAYLLMQNPTDTEVAVARFSTQSLMFDNTSVPLHDAFIEPVVVPAQDRVMVRLDSAAINVTDHNVGELLDVNHLTGRLPQGTRVIESQVSVTRGVGTVVVKRFA